MLQGNLKDHCNIDLEDLDDLTLNLKDPCNIGVEDLDDLALVSFIRPLFYLC